MKVLQFPLVKITFWFVLGILYSFYTNILLEQAFLLLFVAFFSFGVSYFFSKKEHTPKIYFGLTLYFLSFSVGIITKATHTDFYQKNHYIHHIKSAEKEHWLTITLRTRLKDTKYCHRYIAQVKKTDQKHSMGLILINFYRTNSPDKFVIGNIIILKGKVIKHEKPKNPNQFDYGEYLTHKSILSQVYVNAGEYKVSPKIDKDIWYYSNQLRNRIVTNLKNSGFGQRELNVVAALILGQQQDIAPDLLQDYQYAGAIHILSVSGLHVGYLLLSLTFLLSALPKNKLYDTLKLGIILIALWGFAILASLSPSVVRSVTMFSIVAIGMHLRRKTNIYNTLCISVFFILLFEPSFLFDVGFQLSYAALFFIVWVKPLISGIWHPKNAITKYFWGIIAVSTAAQIGALPLSIYYFHQFPGLFFITNIIILPGLGMIMLLGVLLMSLAAFDIVPLFLSKTLEWSIYLLNDIIHWVASFESFILKNIPFNGGLLLSLYLLIITVVIWFKRPDYYKIIAVFGAIILFQSVCFVTLWQHKTQKELIIFNIKRSTVIGEKNGSEITLMSNDSIENNMMLQSYLVANFNPKVNQKPLKNTIYYNGKKILIIDQSGVYLINHKPDIIIISKSPKFNLERMLEQLHPKIVIADASNFKTDVKKWKETCSTKKIPFHATSEKGFYRLQ
jgi:competence protein ComEC